MTPDQISRCGQHAGRDELLIYLAGGKLSYRQTLRAKCFECMNGYADGRMDCLIPTCPNHPYMPYRKKEPKPKTVKGPQPAWLVGKRHPKPGLEAQDQGNH